MLYESPNTSSNESSFALVFSCRFARLMESLSSLLDMIFRVSFTLLQSSMLMMTDLGVPSVVVMNSTFGNTSDNAIFNTSLPEFMLAKRDRGGQLIEPWGFYFGKIKKVSKDGKKPASCSSYMI